jgi:hypothetical protein
LVWSVPERISAQLRDAGGCGWGLQTRIRELGVTSWLQGQAAL